MSKVAYIQASFEQAIEFDIQKDNINYDDIEEYWCKWGTLYVEMKDGTSYQYECSHEFDVDYKYPDKMTAFNKKYDRFGADQDD